MGAADPDGARLRPDDRLLGDLAWTFALPVAGWSYYRRTRRPWRGR
ncbi:hypothetical protein [Micromonospora parva]